MSSVKDLFNFPFSHIYVEEKVMDHELTRKILSRYAKSSVIPIAHYKDVFNRPNQSFLLQKAVPLPDPCEEYRRIGLSGGAGLPGFRI